MEVFEANRPTPIARRERATNYRLSPECYYYFSVGKRSPATGTEASWEGLLWVPGEWENALFDKMG